MTGERLRGVAAVIERHVVQRGVAFLLLVVGLALGAASGTGGIEALPLSAFGTPELVGWSLLAVVTGGVSLGGRTRRAPVLAAGLVGSAALLGATPAQCVVVAVAGTLGGLRVTREHLGARLVGSSVVAWAMPGILGLAAAQGGGEIGQQQPLPVAALGALWVTLAVVLPLVESLGTRLLLPEAEHVDAVHMFTRRLEPQSVLTALAILAAMTYLAIGATAGILLLLPAAAARVGFVKLDEGRRAVAQTLAAMSALPEWVGIIGPGHTGRVRAVAERVALDLGLESRVRRDVVRAAELHELGHLEGGRVSDDRGRIARSGAAVLEQAGMHGRVVRILDATDPDRVLQSPDADVELGAAIVAAACELDRMGAIPDAEEAARRVQIALGRAHRSAAAYL